MPFHFFVDDIHTYSFSPNNDLELASTIAKIQDCLSDLDVVPENFCVFRPNQKAERRRPFGTGLVRHCPRGLFSPFFTFRRAIFFRQFRLSLAPNICPWVSEDE